MLTQIIVEVVEIKIAKNWNKIVVVAAVMPLKSTNFRTDDCHELKN